MSSSRTKSKHAAARPSKKAKKLPACTKRDVRTKRSKRRKCRVVKKKAAPAKAPLTRLSPSGPVAAPPATASSPDAFPIAPLAPVPGLVVYDGPFGVAEAQRLLYRAGFGPKPGEAEALAALGLRGAVDRLMNPGAVTLNGPAPTGTFLVGGQFAPADKYGHIHLATLDRQVRSTDQLGERMVMVLHDWFGVSHTAVDKSHVWNHLDLLRRGWRGSFRQLLMDVTTDPAMLMFLNGIENVKGKPNENYARELMELYTLGADRGAYTETDVRELARAFTGFKADFIVSGTTINFRFEAYRHDTGIKTLFAGKPYARSGDLGWQDGVNAVVDHPLHPGFVVRKLWSYFVPTEPAAETQEQLQRLYRSSGESLAPLVQAILLHPDLHRGPSMPKPPVVFTAGLLRRLGQGINSDTWIWRCDAAGQLIGAPPNVSGWNDRGWLNTSGHSARWGIVNQVLVPAVSQMADWQGRTETSDEALAAVQRFWGNFVLHPDHVAMLNRIAQESWKPGVAGDYGLQTAFLAIRTNVLRQALPAAPDFQVC